MKLERALLIVIAVAFAIVSGAYYVEAERDPVPPPPAKTRVVTVSPYASYKRVRTQVAPITKDFIARCDYLESEPGVVQGTIPPAEGQQAVVICTAHRKTKLEG